MAEHEQMREAAGTTADLIDALAQTAFATMGGLTKIASDNGLSLTQLRVLAILRDRRLRMTDLAAYLGLEKSTLTGLIARAESRGFVTRAANPDDKRAVDVMLTDEGRILASHLGEDLGSYLDPMVSALDPTEQSALLDLLTKASGPKLGGTPHLGEP